jgi:hypothetical protein
VSISRSSIENAWRYPFTLDQLQPHLATADCDPGFREDITHAHACWTALVEAAVAARDFRKAFNMVGNEARPASLWALWSDGRIARSELAAVILDTWDHGQKGQPRCTALPIIGERRWVEMFCAAGFVSDTDRTAPTTDQTVWRGGPTVTNGYGMSWTSDLEIAEWFAHRWSDLIRVDAAVYGASVRPAAVLGYAEARGEAEVIVNPRRLPQRREVVTYHPRIAPGSVIV